MEARRDEATGERDSEWVMATRGGVTKSISEIGCIYRCCVGNIRTRRQGKFEDLEASPQPLGNSDGTTNGGGFALV